MKNHHIFLLLAFTSCIMLFSFHPKEFNCSNLHKGRFHAYSRSTGAHIIISRIDGIQQDVNTVTKDTTYWKIDWLNSCRFAATYLSGAGPKNEDQKLFYQNTILYFDILEMTNEYYVGTTTVKAPNGTSKFSDTTWYAEKPVK